MVSTQRTPEKTPPAGVRPPRRDLSRRGQWRAQTEQEERFRRAEAEREERRQRCQQESVATVGAMKEQAQPTPPPLLTQPPPPSTQPHRSAVVAAIDLASTLNFADAEVEEEEDVDLAAVGGVYRSDDDDDDHSGDEERCVVRMEMAPGGKMTGETEDVEPEEKDDEDDKKR